MEMLTKEMVGDEDIAKAKEPKYDYSDENYLYKSIGRIFS